VSSQVAKYKFLRSATIVPVVPRKADGSLDRGALQALSPAGQPRG